MLARMDNHELGPLLRCERLMQRGELHKIGPSPSNEHEVDVGHSASSTGAPRPNLSPARSREQLVAPPFFRVPRCLGRSQTRCDTGWQAVIDFPPGRVLETFVRATVVGPRR